MKTKPKLYSMYTYSTVHKGYLGLPSVLQILAVDQVQDTIVNIHCEGVA